MPIVLRLVLLLSVGVASVVLGRRKDNGALVFGGGALIALGAAVFLPFAAATIL